MNFNFNFFGKSKKKLDHIKNDKPQSRYVVDNYDHNEAHEVELRVRPIAGIKVFIEHIDFHSIGNFYLSITFSERNRFHQNERVHV